MNGNEFVAKKRRNYVKKVEHKWAEDEIQRLIAAVEERRLLWDVGAADYKLPKTNAWQDVADAIGNITVDDAKAKWANLRITFKNNLSKYRSKKSDQATGELVAIHWRYFNSLMFLEANDVQQSSGSTSLPLANTDMSASEEDFSVTASTPDVVIAQRRKRSATSRLMEMPSPEPSLAPSPTNGLLREITLRALDAMRLQDEYSVFGEFIAGELRSLPPERAIYVKRELTRSLLQLMDAEQPPQPPSSHLLS